MKPKARVIAMYLPQYYPIPENDEVWGKGFTEWNNVAKARPLFRGHHQPNIPADLGFYDLRLPEIREQQAEFARNAGVEGFMYWHYWMGNGKRLLNRPIDEVLESGKPDFPFCFGWANHDWKTSTWTTIHNFEKNHMICPVVYSEEDYIAHFNWCLKAFKDPRYIKVDGKPFFLLYDALALPDHKHFFELWNKLARGNGFPGIHFVGLTPSWDYQIDEQFKLGYDAVVHGKISVKSLDVIPAGTNMTANFDFNGKSDKFEITLPAPINKEKPYTFDFKEKISVPDTGNYVMKSGLTVNNMREADTANFKATEFRVGTYQLPFEDTVSTRENVYTIDAGNLFLTATYHSRQPVLLFVGCCLG